MPRITPIRTRDQVPPNQQEAFDKLVALRGAITGPSNFLMYSPQLNLTYSPIVSYFREQSPISMRHQEVAILTTVREKHSAYPWGAHVARGREAGVPEATIDAIRSDGDVSGLDPDDAAIVTYARQLQRTNHTEQTAFDTLHQRYGTQWLVELTLLIGHYTGTALFLNAMGFEAAPGADRLPD